MNREARQLGNLVVWFTAVGMALLLGLIVFALIRGGPSHDDILEHQEIVQDQLTYISCLLLIPFDDRSPEAVAQCQVTSVEDQ